MSGDKWAGSGKVDMTNFLDKAGARLGYENADSVCLFRKGEAFLNFLFGRIRAERHKVIIGILAAK